jgi:hypothetical protein
VTDGRATADLDARACRHVHDRAVLHVGPLADDDRIQIAAQHRVVPDRGARLDGHVADEDGGGRDERGRVDVRLLAFEAEEWHGLDPRSMLGVELHLI